MSLRQAFSLECFEYFLGVIINDGVQLETKIDLLNQFSQLINMLMYSLVMKTYL